MNGLNPDRWLERQADDDQMRQRDQVDEDRECEFCPKHGTKRFHGVDICRECVESGIRICTECGGSEFIDGPEGPTMCVDCRAIDTDSTPEWEVR